MTRSDAMNLPDPEYPICPKCNCNVEYACGCPDGRPTFPLIFPAENKPLGSERVPSEDGQQKMNSELSKAKPS